MLALRGDGWLKPHLGCFTPRKEIWYLLYMRLGGYLGQSGCIQKTVPPLGFEPQTIESVVSHYVDYAILALECYCSRFFILHLFSVPLLIFIPPLLHIHVTLHPDMCSSPNLVAYYHILSL